MRFLRLRRNLKNITKTHFSGYATKPEKCGRISFKLSKTRSLKVFAPLIFNTIQNFGEILMKILRSILLKLPALIFLANVIYFQTINAQNNQRQIETKIENLIKQLTLDEKISLIAGTGLIRLKSSDKKGWLAEEGDFKILVGSSSRDIRLTGDYKLNKTISRK